MKKENKKVIYAEVKPEIHKILDYLSKKLDLPKTKVISKALKELNDKTVFNLRN